MGRTLNILPRIRGHKERFFSVSKMGGNSEVMNRNEKVRESGGGIVSLSHMLGFKIFVGDIKQED